MLRTNLATRPFYNDRAVRSLLGLLALVAIALTLFNVYETLRLRSQSSETREAMARNDAQARDMRDKAQAIRRSIDRTRLDAVQAAAREANALIDRRTFSWTELLNHFQTTLPADVRIAGVTPQLDNNGKRLVQISIYARRAEDIEEFMDALENTGAFSGVLPRTESPEQDGSLRAELQAFYSPVADRKTPPATGQAGSTATASESNSAPPANSSTPRSASAGGPR